MTVEEKCVAGRTKRLLDGEAPIDIGLCRTCMGMGCTEPNEADGEYRTMAEYRADVGESLLRKSATWKPADDCADKTVLEMLVHIFKTRQSYAVAPNGHTCPFITVEEWSRIADFAKAAIGDKT